MALPTEKRKPTIDLAHMPIMIYGPPKIGKSEFCSQAEDALFIATEAGLENLEVYEKRVQNWEEIVEAYTEIKAGNHKYKTIVLDTIDNAYAFCLEHFCKKHGMDHPSDLGYGKGWALVNGPFKTLLNRFGLLPYGLILVSHGKEREITTRTGPKTKMGPALSGSIADTVAAFVEMILYFTVEETKDAEGNPTTRRVIRTQASELYEAGSRVKIMPDPIDLNFGAFMTALKNLKQQEAKK